MKIPDRSTISWFLGGISAAATGAWAVYKYFADRQEARDIKKATQATPSGIPPEQVVAMMSAMLNQMSGAQPVPSPLEDRDKGKPLDSNTLGKFLARVLRHEPSAAFVSLNEEGWANVDTLIAGVTAAGFGLDRDQLRYVVATSIGHPDGPRFALSGDEKRIRANWGHTIQVRSPGR